MSPHPDKWTAVLVVLAVCFFAFLAWIIAKADPERRISAIESQWNQISRTTYRMRTPHGWLVKCAYRPSDPVALTYVPDEEGTWK